MINVLIRHRVEDYGKWKAAFDAFIDNRKAGGEKFYQIFQLSGDPNNLILLFGWESEDSAKAFLDSEDLKGAMQQAGVLEPPEIHIMERVDQGKLE